MGSTTRRGYWFPAGNDEVALFPGQNELLFMKKLDTDMDTALTANIAAARIPNLAASKITSGTFAEARIPTIKKEKLDSLVWAQVSEMIQDESGGGDGIGAFVTVPRNEDVTTAATEIKAAKDSNTGLVFLTAKVICSSSFTNGDVIGTLPNGYVTPTGFDKPVFAKPSPPTGAEQTAAADTLTFNPNNGEMTLTLAEMPEEGMWLNINTVFSENYIGTTR